MKLNCQNFSIKSPSGQVVFSDFSQEMPFTSLAIMGKSGSGKTSFLKSLLQTPNPHFQYGGQLSLEAESGDLVLGRDIRVIPQSPQHAFDPQRKIGKQLAVILKQRNDQYRTSDIKLVLETSRLDETYLDKFPYQLSGGQLQRLIYALALVKQPRLIIADEPTSAMDQESVDYFKEFMTMALRQGSRLIFTSHDLELCRELGQEFLIIDQTKLHFGQFSELDRRKIPYLEELKEAQVQWQTVTFPEKKFSAEDILLSFHQVSKHFSDGSFFWKKGEHLLYQDLSFAIAKGEVMAICGKNGTGKSTLIKLALGLEKVSSGEIETKAQASLVFQQAKSAIDPSFTVFDTLKETDAHLSKEAALNRLSDVGLAADKLNQSVLSLSGGEQQRLAIARTLVQRAEIIYFDEPFSSLDLITKLKIFNLLVSLREKYLLTYVIVTHEKQLESKVNRVLRLENNSLTLESDHD